MKVSDIPEANRLLDCLTFTEQLGNDLASSPLHIGVGTVTITVAVDDPQRPLLDAAVRDFVAYSRREAAAKLKGFNLEQDLQPSEISGFPEDDLPPPEDPA